ncbi:hypothetical protein ACF8GD_00450 [Pseudomonas putida]|uniref:hypothetical protein n=1 Tax=Pseudomonas putida TaxID=303 RepID=UPI00370AB5A4
MKLVSNKPRMFFPWAPAAAEFNGLAAVPPKSKEKRKRLGPADRSKHPRRLRGLSTKQQLAFDGLLSKALYRVQEEAEKREAKYLRRFDDINATGCRTYQQRWDALARMMGPMLARLNLATMVLGYLNEKGHFRLNRQRGLAEDSGVAEWTVSRVLTDLEEAKYIRRKFRRIFHNGKQWITRVTINVRPRFFIDLGLGHLLAEARNKAHGEWENALKAVKAAQRKHIAKEEADKIMRKQSHEAAKRSRYNADQQTKAEYKLQWSKAWNEFSAANAHLSHVQRGKLFAQAYPQFKRHPDTL